VISEPLAYCEADIDSRLFRFQQRSRSVARDLDRRQLYLADSLGLIAIGVEASLEIG